MTKHELLNQYTWVMKVLDSCTNDLQVETTQKLFDLYIKKWNVELKDKYIDSLSSNFEKEKRTKLHRVRRKKGSFISKVSQFFIF